MVVIQKNLTNTNLVIPILLNYKQKHHNFTYLTVCHDIRKVYIMVESG